MEYRWALWMQGKHVEGVLLSLLDLVSRTLQKSITGSSKGLIAARRKMVRDDESETVRRIDARNNRMSVMTAHYFSLTWKVPWLPNKLLLSKGLTLSVSWFTVVCFSSGVVKLPVGVAEKICRQIIL